MQKLNDHEYYSKAGEWHWGLLHLQVLWGECRNHTDVDPWRYARLGSPVQDSINYYWRSHDRRHGNVGLREDMNNQ
eukprot:4040683-Amphidinium_carterae.1